MGVRFKKTTDNDAHPLPSEPGSDKTKVLIVEARDEAGTPMTTTSTTRTALQRNLDGRATVYTHARL